MPRIELDWRLTELDKRSLQAGHQAVAEELGRTGLGRLQIDDWLRPTSPAGRRRSRAATITSARPG